MDNERLIGCKGISITGLAIVLLLCAVSAADLTGTWSLDVGGNFYIRQIGNDIWWYGESSATNPSWSNVAHGVLSDEYIFLDWADVPKGGNAKSGTLSLEVVNLNELSAIEETGGFSGSEWTRVGHFDDTGNTAPVEVGKEYDVEIEDIAKQGDGIARIEGFTIFVPDTKLGNQVTIVIDRVMRRFALGHKV